MHEPDLIETYLDDLLSVLRVDGHRARRIVAETEDHLHEAVDHHLADGLPLAEAQSRAIAGFGPAAQLAAQFAGEAATALPLRSWFFRLYLYLALLAGVGLLAVGVAGSVSTGIGLGFGKDLVAGNQPGAAFTGPRCQDLFEYHKEAASCGEAAVLHHFDEEARNAVLALGIGVLLVAAHLWLRRRRVPDESPRSGPRRVFAALGMAAFAAAAPLLLAFGIAATVIDPHSANVQYIVDGAVALLVFAMFARPGLRAMREMAAEYAA